MNAKAVIRGANIEASEQASKQGVQYGNISPRLIEKDLPTLGLSYVLCHFIDKGDFSIRNKCSTFALEKMNGSKLARNNISKWKWSG